MNEIPYALPGSKYGVDFQQNKILVLTVNANLNSDQKHTDLKTPARRKQISNSNIQRRITEKVFSRIYFILDLNKPPGALYTGHSGATVLAHL